MTALHAETAPKLAVVVKGWPRLSETFIAQELLALEQAGHHFDIWSLRFPTDKKRHPLHDQITADVKYLPEYLHQEPARVTRAWAKARRLAGYKTARKIWLRDLWRDPTRNRVRRFGQACVLATELPPETRGLYAHFLHTPSSVARYAAIMMGIDWSFSAHAKDIWTSPDWEIEEKLETGVGGAAFGVTCTGFGSTHLQAMAQDASRVELLYHGLDLDRFPAPPDARDPSDVFRILSVGRLVEKKGFDRLIEAFALLPADMNWHWTHIGGGGLKDELQTLAQEKGVLDRIDWRGACDQPEVVAAMRSHDVFVLPSRIADDGDRDGLPNVLMEAASQKLPILSTPVSAIPEFITSGTHGLLVEDAPQDMAQAMVDLAQDSDLRTRFADAAYDRLVADFGVDAGIAQLSKRLKALLA
ncbi:glycosyltransferase family 4 protein [Amylibacter sp. IMCC11727]|uniref:glycosyltransferase family 4 protein n=1 Tax=Amylibacter sp. IMCC11727 TaxID=3039851 RepID=UPI00244E14C3|nr:glycosyltransferase family 4 protein [Amylibacter sp. IMCC11727]WGI22242.1 glycosyltransferase family 4 protein [Amylibacter sp. IMCC11727]